MGLMAQSVQLPSACFITPPVLRNTQRSIVPPKNTIAHAKPIHAESPYNGLGEKKLCEVSSTLFEHYLTQKHTNGRTIDTRTSEKKRFSWMSADEIYLTTLSFVSGFARLESRTTLRVSRRKKALMTWDTAAMITCTYELRLEPQDGDRTP